MDPVKHLRDFLLAGLRNWVEVAADHPSLATCKYNRVTENGIKPFQAISIPAAIAGITVNWPWPQLFRGRENTYVADKQTIYNCVGGSFTPFQIFPIDLEDQPIGITNAQPWEYVDFGDTEMLLGSSAVLYKTRHEGDTRWRNVGTSPKITAGCTYKDGQAILAGFDVNNAWHSLYVALWSRYTASDLPPEIAAFISATPAFAHTNWIWWSSIGGGDLLSLLNPRLLIHLNPLEVETVGPELVTNGSFTGNITGWTNVAGWAYFINNAACTANGDLTQTLAVTPGKFYQIGFDINFNGPLSRLFFRLGTGSRTRTFSQADNGVGLTYVVCAQGTSLQIHAFNISGGESILIDNVTVKEVAVHSADYGPNQLPYQTNGIMQGPTQNTAWGAADGTSSWIAQRRWNSLLNSNFYQSARGGGFWREGDWLIEWPTPTDYTTHGILHRYANPIPAVQSEDQHMIVLDDTKFYTGRVIVRGQTQGSIALAMGGGTNTGGRKNTSDAFSGNGAFTSYRLQTDIGAGSFNHVFQIEPSADFDGEVTYASLVEEVEDRTDDGAVESVANHTVLKQLSAAMRHPVVAGSRYRVTWDQMTRAGVNIVKWGSPQFEWNQPVTNLDVQLLGKSNWNAVSATTAWYITSQRNICSNGTFKLSSTGWTLGTGWAWASGPGDLQHTAGNTAAVTHAPAAMWFAPVNGRTYNVLIRLNTGNLAGSVTVRFGSAGGSGNTFTIAAIASGFHQFNIKADNAATNWDTLYIIPSSDYDGAVADIAVMDPTQSTLAVDGCFENYGPQGDPLIQLDSQMSTFPLIAGQSYSVTFTVLGDRTSGQTVRANLGGTHGTFRSTGTFTETIVCGSGNSRLDFECSLTAASIRINAISLVPLFQNSVRPVLATQSAGIDGVSSYFTNTKDSIYETFSRTILVPGSPVNLDLEFHTNYAALPVRISRVLIEPLDGLVNPQNLLPKPLLFDFMDRNEFGFAPSPYQGTVLHTRQLGDEVMIYGDRFVCFLENHLNPIPCKAVKRLPGYPNAVGIASKGAVGGTLTEQVWLDEKGDLWHVAEGKPPRVTRLRFQEFFLAVLGTTVKVVYDPQEQGFHISNGTVAYYLQNGKLSQSPYSVTSLEFYSGGLVGYKVNVGGATPAFEVTTNNLRSPNGSSIEIGKIQVIGRDLGSATPNSIGGIWTVYVDSILRDQDNWNRFGPYYTDGRGVVQCKVLGVEHRIVVQATDSRTVELNDILAFYSDDVEHKPKLQKWVTG